MKHVLFYTLILLSALCNAKTVTRQQLNFDQGWMFRLCPNSADVIETLKRYGISDNPFSVDVKDAKSKALTDTETAKAQINASENTSDNNRLDGFKSVQIPHDWSVELPFDKKVGGAAGYLAGGQGLYVKEFVLPSANKDSKKYVVAFSGVYHRATVWLNGHRLGYHLYGYTGFEYNLTPYLNKNGKNTLVVHVNREEQSRWYTGSGIYRHVWLKVTSPTHLKTNGVCITTADDGTVNITANIDTAANDRGKQFRIKNTIYNNEGKIVKGKVTERWHTSRPYLYTAVTQLLDSHGKTIDEVSTAFGYRTFQFDANKGFSLNGESMKLKGVCLHQDAGSLGVAVPDDVWVRRLKALKGIGCNAIRCSHNPPSPEFLDICDSLGLVVIDEAFDKWKSGYYGSFFDVYAIGDITDMITRDRNHPSVIVWGIGNEVMEAFSKDGTGVKRAKMLHDLVKTLDSTRPTLVACQQGFADEFGNVTDLVGYNYLEPRMIADHKRHPQRKMLVTEAFPYYSGLRENLVRDYVEVNPWHFVEENDFVAGSFVWAGVDYLGESAPWPAKGWCCCPFDMTMKERPQAAFYHPAWKPEEDYLKLMVRDNYFDQPMGKDHWQYPPMADTWDLPYIDARCVQIQCYTTCDSVQFYYPMFNNPKYPLKARVTKDFPNHCITIQIPSQKGKVLAVGFKDGREVVRDSLMTLGDVADVRIDADNADLAVLPKDMTPKTKHRANVSHLRISLVDKDGFIQQMQPRKFRVETEGPIRLLGVETGDMRRMKSWRTTELTTYFGEALVRLQSTNIPGTATVKVFVEGFNEPFVQKINVTL